MKSVNGEQPEKPGILSQATFIALVSGLAYLVVCSYDAGFCSYFRIPASLIVVSVPGLIWAALVFVAIIFNLPNLFPVPEDLHKWMQPFDWVVAIVGSVALWGCIYLGFYVLHGAAAKVGTIVLGGAISLLSGWYNLHRTAQRKRREEGATGNPAGLSTVPSPYSLLANFLPSEVAWAAVTASYLAVVLGLIAYFGGQHEAKSETQYGVIDGNQRKVILAIYGDTAVAARYYPARHAVDANFTLYKVGGTLPPFSIKNVGPLTRI